MAESEIKKEWTSEEILKKANEICAPHNIKAEFLGENKTVGVQGDNRTYTFVICLIFQEEFRNWEILEKLSNQISSELPINRITLEIARLKPKI